jgi:peroxiredoxin
VIGGTISPSTIGLAMRSALWGLATWLVLRLHDAPIAQGHSICGPWGCGPTIPALVAAHGFWLLVLIPAALWVGSRIASGRAIVLGWACIGLGIGGIATIAVREWMSWPSASAPGLRAYTIQRLLFAVATLVEIPLVPTILAGLILLRSCRHRSRKVASRGLISPDGCDDGRCEMRASSKISRDLNRIEVGDRMPEITLHTSDGRTIVVPTISNHRSYLFYFMRSSGCSICRKHVLSLIRRAEDFRALGIEVIIVHPGGNPASKRLTTALSVPFQVASGRTSKAYEAVGFSPWGFGALHASGTLLVDNQGMVRSVRLASLPFRAFGESELLAGLRLLADEVG